MPGKLIPLFLMRCEKTHRVCVEIPDARSDCAVRSGNQPINPAVPLLAPVDSLSLQSAAVMTDCPRHCRGLLANAEAAEDPIEDIVGIDDSHHFPQGL